LRKSETGLCIVPDLVERRVCGNGLLGSHLSTPEKKRRKPTRSGGRLGHVRAMLIGTCNRRTAGAQSKIHRFPTSEAGLSRCRYGSSSSHKFDIVHSFAVGTKLAFPEATRSTEADPALATS
jgi:hypothetical protein